MTPEHDSTLPFRSQWILRLLYERRDGIVGFGPDDEQRVQELAERGLVEIVDAQRTDLIYARLSETGCHYVEDPANGG